MASQEAVYNRMTYIANGIKILYNNVSESILEESMGPILELLLKEWNSFYGTVDDIIYNTKNYRILNDTDTLDEITDFEQRLKDMKNEFRNKMVQIKESASPDMSTKESGFGPILLVGGLVAGLVALLKRKK